MGSAWTCGNRVRNRREGRGACERRTCGGKQPTERGAMLTHLPGATKLAPTTMCVRTHTPPNRGERARSRQMGIETHQRSCKAAIARRQRQHINAVHEKEKKKHLEKIAAARHRERGNATTQQRKSSNVGTRIRGYSTTHQRGGAATRTQ